MTNHEIFPQTAARLAQWQSDPDVLGVLLVGSKSRGHNDERSDDDLEVLLSDTAFARYEPAQCSELLISGEGATRKLIYDAQYTTLSDVQRKRRSAHDLDHWPYEKARVLFDRDGQTQDAVLAAARMDAEFRRLRLLHATIDAWAAPYRAQKTAQRGFEAASHLLVARGAKALTRLLFALEWRWVPLDHWLEAELRTLADPAQAGPLVLEALRGGQPAPLVEALRRLEDALHAAGVPRADGRHDLFMTLIHPARAAERAIHALC